MEAHTGTGAGATQGLHILGFEALFASYYLVINLLPLIEGTKARGFDSGVMDKNILPALGSDKAKALSRIEPMNLT